MTKTVTFYYVRHGQTQFNRLHRMQGRCDSPLEEEGIAQAYAAKEALKDVPFVKAYTSTSERCVDTAHIVLEGRDVPLYYRKDLKEMSWGEYEGAKLEDHLEQINKRRMGTYDWSDVGGENIPMLKERVLNCYNEIYEECEDGDKVLIVSHGAIFMHMIHMVFGLDLDLLRKLMKEYGEDGHPIHHGFAGVFTICDGKFELLELVGHNENILKELKRQAQ